eukprot:CAMPEP_0119103922 /NCGR_PEP_ID=MMETSP1180-20130426/2263_1 /TAXON_ID=3052 ORGANISM="Chlamydomonas cf sp, Strain CCMP681" /NCGR_SAMPLE_ID=MMETSP1180 /ASSEMBLY_ACC=CAM_ASM_000741 /LENGTH=212 /DNA_ID=CAMNT_0007088545 /DNA_START=96 /DNA_END=735 /DNA_ORIENTATION=-
MTEGERERERKLKESLKGWQGLAKPWMVEGTAGIKDKRPSIEEWQAEAKRVKLEAEAQMAKMEAAGQTDEQLARAHREQLDEDRRRLLSSSGKGSKHKKKDKEKDKDKHKKSKGSKEEKKKKSSKESSKSSSKHSKHKSSKRKRDSDSSDGNSSDSPSSDSSGRAGKRKKSNTEMKSELQKHSSPFSPRLLAPTPDVASSTDGSSDQHLPRL